ncbi:metalloprotease [Luteolibacter sp. Populi]|uniref:metalloprotease n=1 Tax=Luteolibacter sp. Populi TaxID=3230487 RepID=UPI0034661726
MVRFTLFGVPVEIQPWFWLTTAMLSGGLSTNSNPDSFKRMLFFIFAAAISILVHEFGHALTGRRLGGGRPRIVLWAMGGLAYSEGARLTKWGRFWMVAAGPGAGFLLLLALYLVMMLGFGPEDASKHLARLLFGVDVYLSDRTVDFFQSHMPLYWLLNSFLLINFWWGVINLLPVLPLDGGRITELFVRPQKLVYKIGIAAAIAMVAWACFQGRLFTIVLFGYLAYQNYRSIQQTGWR